MMPTIDTSGLLSLFCARVLSPFLFIAGYPVLEHHYLKEGVSLMSLDNIYSCSLAYTNLRL